MADARSWRALREEAETRLGSTMDSDTARAEARWIVLEASGFDTAELLVEEDEDAPALARHRIDDMVSRRMAGEPLQYVLGSWSFRGIDLMVDHRVLIPRPETEVVAQAAIDELVRLGARVGRTDPWSAGISEYAVADLGTGSGAIALALATELPDAAVWGIDNDADALAVARANLSSIGAAATRVRLVEGDWFDALPIELRGELRLVVSNPPYVSAAEHRALPTEIAEYEPTRALVSGDTGFECIERIVADAPEWLEPRGVLVVEVAPHQTDDAVRAAADAGFDDARVERDLTGQPRALVARNPR